MIWWLHIDLLYIDDMDIFESLKQQLNNFIFFSWKWQKHKIDVHNQTSYHSSNLLID